MARGTRGTGGPRRLTQWGGFGDNAGAANLPGFITAGSGASAILSQGIIIGGAAGLVEERATIVRMIGSLTIQMAASTALLQSTVAVGCFKTRQEAITAGVASLPDVETSPDAEWLWYGVYGLTNPDNALRDGNTSSIRVPIHSAAMRKLDSGESVVWIAEAQTSAALVQVSGRYLVKLT